MVFQVIPGWSRYNQLLQDPGEGPLPQNIGYMPIINHSPDDLATVYTVLSSAINTVDALDYEPSSDEATQPSVTITVDQAVYAKAVEVCNNPCLRNHMKPVVLRLGAFHTAMTFIAVIGKRYGSAGLRDILIESDVIAEGSVDQVLNGRQYNRAINALKIVMEAMWRVRWAGFLQWLAEAQGTATRNMEQLQHDVTLVRHDTSIANVEALISSDSFAQLEEDLALFQSTLGPNATFWSEFIVMVQLLLCFIRASRTRSWSLHLRCLQEMLPWLAAYDRTNYSRYLPLYFLDMLHLPQTHPDAHEELANGAFAVQRSFSSTFSSIPHDQTIEVTINKDTKVRGGLVGKTLRHDATNKWIWTAADKAAYFNSCKDMCGLGSTGTASHKDGGAARMQRDEKAVQRVIETVSHLVNPFVHHEMITHLTSGKYATPEIETDLLRAHNMGEQAMSKFVLDRLSSEGEISFYDRIPKLSLKTFASFIRKSKNQPHVSCEQETAAVFAQLYDIGQETEIPRSVLMSYELTSIPRSLADANGARHKGRKADLLHILRDMAEDVSVPQGTTHVIDAMCLLHGISRPAPTYEALALQVLHLMLIGTDCKSIVHWVVDTYPPFSIKATEHGLREEHTGNALEYTIKSGSQHVPSQFKRALRSGPYKEELLKFFLENWKKEQNWVYIGQRTLYITAGSECHCITSIAHRSVQCVVQPDLECTHEEADTRILLHAKHASIASDSHILLRSTDTDVLTLAVYVCSVYPMPLIFRVQEDKAWRCISVTSISRSLGPVACLGLPGMHSFSGCDSTSQFLGHGKKTAMKCLRENDTFRHAMTVLGDEFTLGDTVSAELERAVCILYNCPQFSNTNEVRNYKWNRVTKDITKLPPCQDSLKLHLKRANYQAAVWKRCFRPKPNTPSPHGHGWDISDGVISIVWMSQPRAPEGILNTMKCGCKSAHPCSTRRCGCRQRNMQCTQLCMCNTDCFNMDVTECDDEDSDSD